MAPSPIDPVGRLDHLAAQPPWLRSAVALALGSVAALVFTALGAPLPWLIGPLLATASASMAGAPLAAMPSLRNVGQVLIGTALGLDFTPQVVALVVSHWAAVVGGIAWALALGTAFAAFLRRANRSDPALDRATLFFSGAIGGAGEMTVLAERHGGRTDVVAAAHSLRVLMVVVLVPFAFQWAGVRGLDASLLPGAGAVHAPGLALLLALALGAALAARRFGVVNAWMLGPLVAAFALTACSVELSALPRALTGAAQLFIGVALGTRFTPAFLRTAPRWLATVAAGTLLLMLASAGYALALAALAGLHPATVLLGTAPGGVAEMCLTAKVLQLGVPVVTAFHVTRMAGVVLLAGPLFRRLVRRSA